jgi:hypothetical protein
MALSARLRRKARTFVGLSAADRLLVGEAVVALGLARLVVIALPFRLTARWLDRTPGAIGCDEKLLLRVRMAVTAAARNVPWNAVCLPQAMAAKAMLARRGCGSRFHLGAGFDTHGELIAHAWLTAGGTVVVGSAGIASVTPIAQFGRSPY